MALSSKKKCLFALSALVFIFFFMGHDCLYGEDTKKIELTDIVVTEKRYKGIQDTTKKAPVTPIETLYGTQFNVVTEDQIKEQVSQDFLSTLRDVPGVMIQTKNLAGSQTSHSLYIRGRGASHPSPDVIILFDGAPRFGAIFGQILGDSIPVATIGGMEVYKSPQPSVFGSGYAMINILPKYLKKDGKEAGLDLSGGSYETFTESLSAGIKEEKFDIYASQSLLSTGGHRPHSRASQQNYYANTGYQINKEWNLRFLINYVDAGTNAPMPDRRPNANNGVSWPGAERYETETVFTTLTLNNEHEKMHGFIKTYMDRTDFDLLQELTNGQRYAGGTDGLWSRQEIMLYGLRAKEYFNLWNGGEVIFGVDLDMTELKNTQRTYSGAAVAGINGGKARRVWDFPDTRLFSPYGAISQIIGRLDGFHFIPSAGGRYYNHSLFKDKGAFQTGIVLGYSNTSLNVNYARGVNYPSPVALMNFVLEGALVNDARSHWRRIKPEVVDHYEAGINHKIPEKGSFSATVFKDYGKDRFQTYMSGPVPLRFNDPIGNYEIKGLEIAGTVIPLKVIEIFSAATWMESEAKGGNGVESTRLPYTPGFQFQTGFKWEFIKNYRLYVDMQHLRNLYQGTFTRSGTFNTPNITVKDKLQDITIINSRVSYRFDYKPMHMKDSELFIAINNILNKRYEYAKGYPMPGITLFGGVSLRFS